MCECLKRRVILYKMVSVATVPDQSGYKARSGTVSCKVCVDSIKNRIRLIFMLKDKIRK